MAINVGPWGLIRTVRGDRFWGDTVHSVMGLLALHTTAKCADTMQQSGSELSSSWCADGFHGSCYYGNWRHYICWLVSIYITWSFCPPVSMVKNVLEYIYIHCG